MLAKTVFRSDIFFNTVLKYENNFIHKPINPNLIS